MQAKAPAEADTAAVEKAPVRTVHDWRPEPLLCKRFNVADPFQGQRGAAKATGGVGEQLLSVPAHERGNAYAAALPDFMRPKAAAEGPGGTLEVDSRKQIWEEELPLPPPPSGGPGAPPATAAAAAGDGVAADKLLDQAVDDILASVDADFAKHVEEVRAASVLNGAASCSALLDGGPCPWASRLV